MKFDDLSNVLQVSTQKKIEAFEKIRGKDSGIDSFWDIVVLSSIDPDQTNAYETQLSEKIKRNELPLLTKYHVINDPIGYKVGNGGAVIKILSDLEKIYGDELNEKKILILLSGGFSQRLPSASLLGKIFTALPLGNPPYQMLEMKLAMYINFPERMKPGIFVSSADCIELYELEGDLWNFTNPGVTSLAHPSPIEIGTTHGVYVRHSNENKEQAYSAAIDSCRRFLHKPSKELMRETGAVFMHNDEEYVYSDSAYYMDMPTCHKLLNWLKKFGEIKCEIDAYGDFLQALGPESSPEYCSNTSNVTIELPDLVSTRRAIYDVLQGTQLNVLMLNKSKFYHIGTTKEYIHHFCQDLMFRHEMSCSNTAMVKLKNTSDVIKPSNVFIHSYIEDTSHMGDNIILEYNHVSSAVHIGSNCIISNSNIPPDVHIPSRSFIYSAPVSHNNETRFVTVAFGIEDNLKKCVKRTETDKLSYSGISFDKALKKMGRDEDPWSPQCVQFNLWNAKIFPAFSSSEKAMRFAASFLTSCRNKDISNDEMTTGNAPLFSMADILLIKDLNKLLEMRLDQRKVIMN